MNLYLKKVGFFPTLLFLLCSAAAVSAQMDGEAARDWSVIFRDTLQRSVLQFWIDHALDTKYGGLVGRLNRQGEPIPPGDKSVVLISRLLWSFCAGYRRDHVAAVPELEVW